MLQGGTFNFKKANWTRFVDLIEQRIDAWQAERARGDHYHLQESLTTLERDNARLVRIILRSARQSIPSGNRVGGSLPFWNAACDSAVRAREIAEAKATAPGHSEQDVTDYVAACESCRATMATEQRAGFKTALSQLRPGDNLWRTISAMDRQTGGSKASATIARPGNAKPATTDNEKARLFCQTYAAASNVCQLASDRPLKRQCCSALKSACSCGGAHTGMCSPFSMTELDLAMRKLRSGKSPGTDSIPNELLKALPASARGELIRLINMSWKFQCTPRSWREAEIVAIPKRGKPLDRPDSYRPIIAAPMHLQAHGTHGGGPDLPLPGIQPARLPQSSRLQAQALDRRSVDPSWAGHLRRHGEQATEALHPCLARFQQGVR
jgi:hypothetical protein